MKLMKIFTVTVALFCTSLTVFGQDIEGGIFLGPTNYQGDVTKKHVTISQTRPNLGLLGRYYFGPRFNLKGNLYYGWVRGDDKNYDDQKFRDKRNADFKSTIFDFGVQGELNILPFISNSKRYRFAPYVFAGISLFHFNPKSKIAYYDASGTVVKEETYALQPLGTEGQFLDGKSDAYKRWQGAIPYGVGVKYSLGNFWNIGFEIGQRKIFTDYLDDVSTTYPDMTKQAQWSQSKFNDDRAVYASAPRDTKKYPLKGGYASLSGDGRGNKDRNDMYIFTGITLTKTLRRFSCTNF